MRSIVVSEFGGPEVLVEREAERPSPLPTEILVRVEAAGVNPVDVKTRAGKGMAAVLGDPPFVVGWDVTGVVEEVGAGVTRFRTGDAVLGMPWFPRQAGGYSEYVTAPSRHFARRPEALSAAEAAALPLAGLTAWQSLVETAGVSSGDRVLIHAGGGGVGHIAVQIASSLGAEVITTARESKHDFLAGLGASRSIDYENERFEDVVGDVDVVVDLIGTEDYGLRSLECLREGGLLISVPSGASQAVLDRGPEQGKRVTGILVEPDRAALEGLCALVETGRLRVEVEDVYPLDEAADAHRAIESGRTRGKLVLTV
ncbi:NADP-dependent oxidoreductase [Thermoleophilia bacterium SCSIO 60948]|nr:NADP-dependent oxidoreductase [Thermoleophilia bacterium SCSIO 60948]